MWESGSYPAGAQYDPNAPWNQKEPEYVKCQACNGKGAHWYALNIETGQVTEVTRETWHLLPQKEEEAEAKRERYIRWDVEECDCCDGDGQIEYIPDYDDYDS